LILSRSRREIAVAMKIGTITVDEIQVNNIAEVLAFVPIDSF
jgi:hypothetical protein